MRHDHFLAVVVTVLLAGIWLEADTLILRDGRRVQGSLMSIRNGVVEFEEDRGFRGNRIVRFDRDEVRRVDLDDSASSSFSSESSDRPTDGDGRPAGLRERDIVVSADVPWNDAGIDVRGGQSVYFTATGRVNWGPGRRDGAAGERNSPHNPTRPIPSRPGAALIGKIGDQDPFFIGDERGPVRMRQSGRLYLGINDDYLVDNSGNLRVTVHY
ncbi:MAG TPA: hypothetical protein VH702_10095 [Vicinamibacterales bacterium]|jgi:hypothetical protein